MPNAPLTKNAQSTIETSPTSPTKSIPYTARIECKSQPQHKHQSTEESPRKKTCRIYPDPNVIRQHTTILSNQMVIVSLGKVYQPRFPQWYNPNTTCACHGGIPGHFVEQFVAFKHKVQSLINVGWLTFQEDSPNVRTNSFANHGSSSLKEGSLRSWRR